MAAKVFHDGTVLSWNEDWQSIEVLHHTSILINGDTISAIGKDIEAPADAEVIDSTGKILTPGFINTHSHLWQTAYRTLAPNTTLASYLISYSQSSQAIKAFSAEDIYISCLEGYYEGLNAGVTTYVEHASNNWDLDVVKRGFDAAVDGGARVWWCCAAEDREDVTAEDVFEYIDTLGKRNPAYERQNQVDLAPSSMNEVLLTSRRELGLEAITTHDLGGPWPIGHNTPSIAANKGLQDLDVPIIFSHGGLITEENRAALRKHDWNLSITPESEMHYGHGQQTSRLVQDHASLGVDTNWTFSGDILTQARLWLQSVRNVSYNKTLDSGRIPRENPMAVEDAFLLATRQGGRAVRRDDVGVLKVGAKADIVCFNGNSPNMVGWTDPIAAVVLHANVGDIEHVMVGGEFRKRNGKLILKEGEWEDFSKKFAEAARRIQAKVNVPPQPEKFMGVAEFGEVESMTTRRQT
ncbi:hypothetical protein LTR37_009280 [Vermiconidia calcicola]|uniref:Uncharacterized protein n=1 Tax=Vermiconidia calcicola TaxID=1690605 RepID=A0ACC3N8A1_9PEZI|nr:hypothetical protein LTR37_009280 [Vermiconidia calcicola]